MQREREKYRSFDSTQLELVLDNGKKRKKSILHGMGHSQRIENYKKESVKEEIRIKNKKIKAVVKKRERQTLFKKEENEKMSGWRWRTKTKPKVPRCHRCHRRHCRHQRQRRHLCSRKFDKYATASPTTLQVIATAPLATFTTIATPLPPRFSPLTLHPRRLCPQKFHECAPLNFNDAIRRKVGLHR